MNYIKESEDMVEEWKKFYKASGSPHPSSNKYLEMTRSFWFTKGFEKGQELAKLEAKKKQRLQEPGA